MVLFVIIIFCWFFEASQRKSFLFPANDHTAETWLLLDKTCLSQLVLTVNFSTCAMIFNQAPAPVRVTLLRPFWRKRKKWNKILLGGDKFEIYLPNGFYCSPAPISKQNTAFKISFAWPHFMYSGTSRPFVCCRKQCQVSLDWPKESKAGRESWKRVCVYWISYVQITHAHNSSDTHLHTHLHTHSLTHSPGRSVPNDTHTK